MVDKASPLPITCTSMGTSRLVALATTTGTAPSPLRVEVAATLLVQPWMVRKASAREASPSQVMLRLDEALRPGFWVIERSLRKGRPLWIQGYTERVSN